MNWKSGLFRTWLLLSIIWLVWASTFAVLESSMKYRECVGTNTTGIECLIESLIFTRDGQLPDLTVWTLILSVPVVVLGLGVAIAWILGGFRDPN